MERLMLRAMEAGEAAMGPDGLGDSFVDLLDATTVESAPAAEQLLAILEERGWRGWTRIVREVDVDAARA